MKVSLNTIKKYIGFELPSVEELRKRIDEQLGKVESVVDLTKKYGGAVIVRVVSANKHPNADKLSVCLVDDGGVVADVPRNENGYVQVVCGAPNVHGDMFAIWLPPMCTVPASFDDTEPFVLSARELRGVVSQGMLAAADELAIGSDHNGIIELTNADLSPGSHTTALEPGLSFAETFGLNDVVLDIENKMFTHRPDCFGQLGVAREIAGIFGHQFTSPEWYSSIPEFQQAAELELVVTNDAPEKVPRFMAVAIKDVTVKPSPFWLQCELIRLGSKPINTIVDITNYIMLLTAQPLHAYDYDKLAGHTLGVRLGNEGETLPLLNGKTYTVTSNDIVIVDGEKAIGMGGIMGGGNSEVSADTKNIVLECATFDMYAIRKTSMRHGLFTDAVTRFNKGQSVHQNAAVLAQTIAYASQLCGAAQASQVYDLTGDTPTNEKVLITPTFIIERLGKRIDNETIMTLLKNVEFTVATHGLVSTTSSELDLPDMRQTSEAQTEEQAMYITAPFWRTDIQLPEDVVEEVGRLYGFDKLPKQLPNRSVKPVAKNAKRELGHRIRESFARSGANEVLTYSFVHKNVIERAGQNVNAAYQLGNALSPDLQYYRLSVLPSLIDKVHANIKAGYDEFVLFELGKAHSKDALEGDLPSELDLVEAVYASKKGKSGAAYYEVRTLVEELAHYLGIEITFTPAQELPGDRFTVFEPTRSALVVDTNGKQIGVIGEFRQQVMKAFKLPEYSAGVSLTLRALIESCATAHQQYAPLSRFPSVSQDISLRVASTTSYDDVVWAVKRSLEQSGLGIIVAPVSIYQGDALDKKTLTISIQFTSHAKTLTSADVAPLVEQVVAAAAQQYGAELA